MKHLFFFFLFASTALSQFGRVGFQSSGGGGSVDTSRFVNTTRTNNVMTGAINATDFRASDSLSGVTLVVNGSTDAQSYSPAITVKAKASPSYAAVLELRRNNGNSMIRIRGDEIWEFDGSPLFTSYTSACIWDWDAATNRVFQISGGRASSNTGTGPLLLNGSFNPTSGTSTQYFIGLTPTINQTGGANGITRGIYINPTLTAAADWRAIEIASGAIKEHSLTAALTDGAPTASEINTALGVTSATTAGAGYNRYIKDTNGSSLMYRVVSDGSSWWTFAGTVAP